MREWLPVAGLGPRRRGRVAERWARPPARQTPQSRLQAWEQVPRTWALASRDRRQSVPGCRLRSRRVPMPRDRHARSIRTSTNRLRATGVMQRSKQMPFPATACALLGPPSPFAASRARRTMGEAQRETTALATRLDAAAPLGATALECASVEKAGPSAAADLLAAAPELCAPAARSLSVAECPWAAVGLMAMRVQAEAQPPAAF